MTPRKNARSLLRARACAALQRSADGEQRAVQCLRTALALSRGTAASCLLWGAGKDRERAVARARVAGSVRTHTHAHTPRRHGASTRASLEAAAGRHSIRNPSTHLSPLLNNNHCRSRRAAGKAGGDARARLLDFLSVVLEAVMPARLPRGAAAACARLAERCAALAWREVPARAR